MKRVLASAAVLAAVAAVMILTVGSGGSASSAPTYKIELQDAFGLENGAELKVAGVPAGKITKIDVCGAQANSGCQNPLDAVLTAQITQQGFGQFHQDAFCQSRPESLIGEYFVDCTPGGSGPVRQPGTTITVNHTFSTIPVDLVNDLLRLPYRERLTLLINELGAAVAGRSTDLQTALRRAVPALNQTDNLLNLLSNDSSTINALTVNANTVIGSLAANSKTVQRFIVDANTAAQDSATQAPAISATWKQLPPFLAQLQGRLSQLNGALTANLPVVNNLNQASAGLNTLLRQLPPFSRASVPAIRALGQASVTGRSALLAARPTIADLNRFAQPTPELAQNLSITLTDLDNRGRAVEPDKRSPGGRGYTGLEALLQYVFNQALAINTYNPLGHLLDVDAFIDPLCSPYASPQTVANNLAIYGQTYRRCYAWLGPNQPGINERDPSNLTGCVPDPGGAPPGERGPQTSACKLGVSVTGAAAPATATPAAISAVRASVRRATATASTAASGGGGSSGGGSRPSGAAAPAAGTASATVPSAAGSATTPSSSGAQAQQLLNYLLAP